MQIPRRKSEELHNLKQESGPIHLTAEGLVKLKTRLERLKTDMPNFITETQKAADYGDRSENAEYKDAKARLRSAQRQIWTIEDQLKRVVVIDESKNKSGAVEIGSTVVLELEDGNRKTFQILGSRETRPEEGKISYKSPLGAALMGKRIAETATVATPSGAKKYRILEIS